MELENDYRALLRANAREHIDTCNLIITRMADQFVLMLEDGSVLHSTGIHPFPKAFGDKVQMSRDKAKVQKLLAHVKAQNPDNSAAQALKLGTLKNAARKQRQNSVNILEMLEGK